MKSKRLFSTNPEAFLSDSRGHLLSYTNECVMEFCLQGKPLFCVQSGRLWLFSEYINHAGVKDLLPLYHFSLN